MTRAVSFESNCARTISITALVVMCVIKTSNVAPVKGPEATALHGHYRHDAHRHGGASSQSRDDTRHGPQADPHSATGVGLADEWSTGPYIAPTIAPNMRCSITKAMIPIAPRLAMK